MAKQNDSREQYALQIGTVLEDRYVIKELLGQNGLSITYKVFDTFREQTVALKELYPSAIVVRNFDDKLNVECIKLSDEQLFEDMKQRCIQKAKKMIKLYPLSGIANIIHYLETNQTVYLVMDYIEGIDIPTFFKRKHASRMELNKTIEMLKPVIDSLERIHSVGLFHGRISPDCIVLDAKRNAYLLGFGDPMEEVAQDVFGDNTAREFAFSPLEQYDPNGKQGAATDVYAIGAVVYLCVTGIWPPAFFERVSGVTGEEDPLKTPWELGISIMQSQSDAIMKAMAVFTFERYQSIHEFIDALELEQFADGPTAVIQKRMPAKYAGIVRRRRIVKGICILVAVIALAILAPVVYDAGVGMMSRQFYNSFESKSLYDKCVTLANMSERQKALYANDYEAVTDKKEMTIKYYDLDTMKMVPFQLLKEQNETDRYICLDFRKGNRVIMTYLSDKGQERYECVLEKQGSYYYLTYMQTEGGIESVREYIKVNPEHPDGE